MAMQRFHDNGAVLVAERVDLVEIARDQGRRHQMREIHHEDLFRRIAHAGGIVHHQRLRMQTFEKMRRGDVGEIERRVLPQQDDVESRKRFAPRLAQREMVAGLIAHGEQLYGGDQLLSEQRELVRRVIGKPVAAFLRFQQQREC